MTDECDETHTLDVSPVWTAWDRQTNDLNLDISFNGNTFGVVCNSLACFSTKYIDNKLN